MRYLVNSFLISFLIFQLSLIDTAHGTSSTNLEKQITTLASQYGLQKNQIGIHFISLNDPQHSFSFNHTETFIPASVVKLITSYAALKKWGAHHRFETTLGQYKKSLCLKGFGDPSMVHERMFTLVEKAVSKLDHPEQITTLFVDDSFFPSQKNYTQDFEKDFQRAFTAPIGALALDYNSVTIEVTGTKVGQLPKVRIVPDIQLFQIKNKAVTKNRPTQLDVRIANKKNHWEIEPVGHIRSGETKTYYRSIFDPALYSGHVFAKYFSLLSGHSISKIQKSHCVPETQPLLVYKSKPLSNIIMDMNQYSNNVIAETLFAMLGEDPPSTLSGQEAMKSFLKTQGLDDTSLILKNGSGLSRHSQMTPLWMTQFLTHAYQDFLTQPELFASLGLSGSAPTLKTRTYHVNLIDKLRAKTGSLNAITTLVGMMQTQTTGPGFFALFIDHPKVPAWKIYALEKDILDLLVQHL